MGHPEVKTVDGRREAWLVLPTPGGIVGGWVCGEPDDSQAGQFCGLPIEDEPCSKHHPDAMVDGELAGAAVLPEVVAPGPDHTPVGLCPCRVCVGMARKAPVDLRIGGAGQ